MLNIRKMAMVTTVLLFIIAFVSHKVITRPMDTALFFFPLESFWVKRKITCSPNSPSWLAHLMRLSIDEYKSLANQLAYIDPQGALYHCESGWADKLRGNILVNENHRFRFASMTKVITADLILQLIDDDKVSLNTRLLEVFPEIKPLHDERINDITIGHLLDHSAGFDRTGPEGDIMFFSAKKNWCPDQLQGLAKERLHFTPGEKQIYSNLGYCLLGAVIEKVTGMPYDDYAEKIEGLSRLSLKFVNQTYLPDEVSYDFRFDFQHNETYIQQYDFKDLAAVAGLSGSAVSLARQIETILARPGLNRLTPPKIERCGEKVGKECYGFAFNHYQEKDSLTFFLHSGYLPGVSSNLIVDSKGGILVLTHAGGPVDPYKSNQVFLHEIYQQLWREYDL